MEAYESALLNPLASASLLRKGATMSEGDYLVEISATAVVNDDERQRTLTVAVQDGAVSVRIRTDDEQKQHLTAVLSEDGLAQLLFALQRAQAQVQAQR